MAEDWKNKYLENSDINYGASDYESYRNSFINLLEKLYPENFNDYIDNSEIIMLISSLAYLGENLNYVVEMDTRDNFPSTTERLESLLNFAKMINYPVRRNKCANGLVKIVQIETDEELYDSLGNALRNKPIKWNDISNIYWYEQMMVILNSVLINSNPFGIPVDTKDVNNETYNLYSINVTNRNGISYPFSTTVNGSNMDFEIVNPIIENNNLIEHYPETENYFNIIYKNDGSGYDSDKNGFFLWFKQGNLSKQDENITAKETFKKIDIDTVNINDTDVWVEELNLDGSVKNVWTSVNAVHNPSYSSINPDNKKIYQTITNTGDGVTIKFGDGLTGEIPYGMFRIFYRTSNGLTYSINPKEMTNLTITIPYKDSSYKSDQIFNLTVTFSLKEAVNNSIPSLTISDIQDNLPEVSSTQNRMVTESDYNYFPLSYSNTIKKIIAENRVYSGVIDKMIDDNQSNLIQNVNIIVDDGFLYKNYSLATKTIPLPSIMTSEAIIDTYIIPVLSDSKFENFWYDQFNKVSTYYEDGEHIHIFENEGAYSKGTLSFSTNKINEGSMIQLYRKDANNNIIDKQWCSVVSYVRTIESVVLELNVLLEEGDWFIRKSYIPFNKEFPDEVRSSMKNSMNNISVLNTSGTSTTRYGLKYSPETYSWEFIEEENLEDGEFVINPRNASHDTSWLIWVEWTPTAWVIKWRTIDYLFGSLDTVKFSRVMPETILNYKTNVVSHDFVKFLKINENLLNDKKPYAEDMPLLMEYNMFNDDGSLNQDIIGLELPRSSTNNALENPDSVNDIICVETAYDKDNLIFFKKEQSSLGYYIWKYISGIIVVTSKDEITQSGVYYYDETLGSDPTKYEKGFVYRDENGFLQDVSSEYRAYVGRIGLYAQYKHYVTDYIRIDPVPSAFIEMYVLTSNNYKEVMNWKANPNRSLATFPAYPTEYELMKEFESLEYNKMVTDEMIWRPLKFKLLFGKEADEKLRAEIKVTKKSTSLVADNIIRQRVLLHMENFFDNSRWLNTKEFNYTELASYIYQNMSNDITNCVIVPLYNDYKFGKLYQIRFDEYEIPLNVATLDNIKVIPYISDDNIRIGK